MNIPEKPVVKAEASCLQLKIELAWIKPVIWRRIVVPETIKLYDLHLVIQVVMGWRDCHLHDFIIDDKHYGPPDPYSNDTFLEEKTRLGSALGNRKSFKYIYDFGDSWEHRIKLEKTLPATAESLKQAICLAGANAAPPEDVGGSPGYALFCEAIADPQHPDHAELLAWCGNGSFDPSHFSLDAINAQLKQLKL